MKRDEHRLQPAVVGEASHRVLDDLELAGVDHEAVQHDRAEHDPRDREQAIGRAVDHRDERQARRHSVGHEGDDQTGGKRAHRRDPGGPAKYTEHHEHTKMGIAATSAESARLPPSGS
jgi:hypothetical protein